MNRPERAALAAVASIPRDGEGPVFPAPWAARAFALVVSLNERGLFAWTEWSEALGRKVAEGVDDAGDPEAYWRAWLAALEEIVAAKRLGSASELVKLKDDWRRAAHATPHGRPIELPR